MSEGEWDVLIRVKILLFRVALTNKYHLRCSSRACAFRGPEQENPAINS